MPSVRPRRLVTLLTVTLLATACGAGSDDAPAGPTGGATTPEATTVTLAVAPASFDLAVGEDRRLLLALFTDRRERVAGG